MAKTKEEERWLKEGAQRHRTNVNLAKQKAPAKSGSNANLMKGFYTPAEKPKRAIEKNEALNAVKRAAKMKNTGYTMKQLTDKLTPEMRSGITNSVKERRKKQAESAKEKLSSAKDRRSRAAYRQELRDALYPLTRQERNMSWNDRDNLQDMKSLWSVQQELKERGYTYNVKEIQDSAHRAAEWIRARYGFSGGESGADNILPELSWEDENLTTPEGKRYLRSMKRIYEMAKEDGDQDLMDKAHKGAGEIRNLDGFWDPEKMRAYRDRKPDYQFYDAHGRPRYTPSEWDAETQKNFLPAIGNSVAGSLRAFRETAIQALRNNADNRDNNAYNSAKRNMEIAKQMMAQAKTPEEKEEWQKFLDESTELASSSKIDTPVSKDSPGMKQMERANQQAQRVVEGMDTAVGKRVAEAVLSIGQMAPALATGLVNPALPMVVMGVQAAGSKAYDLAQRGVGASEALMRGTAAGVIEGLTEKIPVGNLLKILDAAGGGRLLKNLLKQAGIEATEESVSYTLNFFADKAAQDPEAEFSFSELLDSAAVGGISGGLMGGGFSMFNFNGPAPVVPGSQVEAANRLLELAAQSMQEETASRPLALVANNEIQTESAENAGDRMAALFAQESGADGRNSGNSRMAATIPSTANDGQAALERLAVEMTAQPTEPASTEQPVAASMRSSSVKDNVPAQATRTTQTAPNSKEQVFGESGQKAYRAVFEGKATPIEYAGFAAYYQAGLTNTKLERADYLYGGAIEKSEAYAAYSAGQNDAAAAHERDVARAAYAQVAGNESGLVYDEFVREAVESGRSLVDDSGEAYLTAENADRINTLAKKLGVRVRFVDSVYGGRANAQISGSEVLIEKNNENHIMFLIGHEMTHRMQKVAPEAYKAFRDAVASELASEIDYTVMAYKDQGESITYEKAIDEAVSDYAGQLIRDGKTLDKFLAEHKDNRSLIQKLRDVVRELRVKLRGTAEEKLALAAEKKLEAALRASEKSVKKLGEGKENAEKEGESREATPLYSLAGIDSEGAMDSLLDTKRSTGYNEQTDNTEGGVNYGRKMGDNLYRGRNAALPGEQSAEGTGQHRKTERALPGERRATGDRGQNLLREDSEGRRLTARELERIAGTAIVDDEGHPLAVYHFTPDMNFETFERGDIGFHFGTQEQAYQRGKDLKAETGRVFRSYLNIQNPYRMRHDINCWQPSHIGLYLWSEGVISDAQWNEIQSLGGRGYNTPGAQRLREILTEQGVDGFAYPNMVEGDGDSYIALHDEQIVRTDVLLVEHKSSVSERRDSLRGIQGREKVDDTDNLNPTENPDIRFSLKSGKKTATMKGTRRGNKARRGRSIEQETMENNRFERLRQFKGDLPENWYAFTRTHFYIYSNQSFMDYTVLVKCRINDANRAYIDAFVEGTKNGTIRSTETLDRWFGTFRRGKGRNHWNYVPVDNSGTTGRYDGVDVREQRSNSVGHLPEGGRTSKVNGPDDSFSLKGTSVDREMASLLKENALLKERVSYWQGQTKRTARATVDKKSVRNAAKQLLKGYHSTLTVEDIQDDLQGLYDYLTGDKDASYGEARGRAEEIGRRLAESAVSREDMLYREYADLRKFLKETKLTLNASDASGIADFAAFRKEHAKRVKLSKGTETNVDRVYLELAERWPEWFDETRDTNVVDQVYRITEAMDKIYTITEANPYSGSMQQATAGVANEIMELFFDLPQTKATFADKAARRLDKEKASGRAKLNQAKEDKRQAVSDAVQTGKNNVKNQKLADDMYYGRRSAEDRRKAQEQKYKFQEQKARQLADLRAKNLEKTNAAIQKERSRRERDLNKLKDKYTAKTAEGKDRQNRRVLISRITKHTKSLSQKLVNPTDKKHVTDGLRGPVAALLEAVNLESQYSIDPATGKRVKGAGDPTKRTQAFLKLKEEYSRIANEGGDMVIDPDLLGDASEDFPGKFDEVIAMGDIKLADMTATQLQLVWDVVSSVEHAVNAAGKVLSKAKFESTKAWAEAMESDTATRRRRKSMTKSHDLETPLTFFSRYGDAGKAIFRTLRNAEDRKTMMMDEVENAVGKIVKPKQVKKMEKTLHTFTTERGDKLTLSTAHVMEIRELAKREQARDHLLKGGIFQPEVKDVQRGTEAVPLTDNDLTDIIGALSEEEAKIADELQKLTATMLSGWGNEASMLAYGYKKFVEKDYWPIKTAAEGRQTNIEKGMNQPRQIKNVGMAKNTKPKAGNPLELGGMFTTFANHTSEMVDYSAWLCPMEDMNRLFNFRFRDEDGNLTGKNIKGMLDRVGGEGSQDYWLNLMDHIQNGIGVKNSNFFDRFFSRGVGNVKGAAVGANIRVIIQQPTAYVRAMVDLNPAYLTAGLVRGATPGNGWKKALKWAPVAVQKDKGSFDVSNPLTARETLFDDRSKLRKFNDAMGAASGAADAATWGKIWNACEHDTAHRRKDLPKGSDEFYRAVSEKFTDIIDQTQVVDSVLQRSAIMRSANAVTQQAVSFKGEPIKSLNVVMRAYDKFRYEQDPKKRGKAIKGLAGATVTFLATASVNAVAQSIIDALRDDDDDKKYLERAIAAFTGLHGNEEGLAGELRAALLEGNFAENVNPAGGIPYISDFLSIVRGFDVERMDMQAWADLFSAGEIFIDSIGGNGRKTPEYAFKQLMTATAKIFGISAVNILRDLWGVGRSVAIERDDLSNQYRMDRLIYNIKDDGNKSRYVGIALKALSAGDMDTYYLIREDLMENLGLGGKELDSSLRSAYKKKLESNPEFSLDQVAKDLLGLGDEYFVPEEDEDEDKFSEDSLSSSDHKAYSTARADSYRKTADTLEGYDAFSGLDNEQKNKLLDSAYNLAKEEALAEHSNGQYQMDTKWMLWATGGEEHGVEPAEAILFKMAYDTVEGDKDESGKTVSSSKKDNVLEAAAEMMPWLTSEEISYLKSNYWSK